MSRVVLLVCLWGILVVSTDTAFAQTPAETSAEAAPQPENPTAETRPAPPPSAEDQPVPSDTTGRDLVERGRNLFEYGDYPSVIKVLRYGLENNRFNDEELLEAHRLLGVVYLILQKRDQAREHFLILLTREPDYELDPLYVPPIIIDFFETTREENKDLLDAIRARRLGEGEARKPLETTTVVHNVNPYYINFIPFGAGQFQNGEPVKGTLFLVGQTVALALNVSGYFMSISLEGSDGLYSKGDSNTARNWRIVQYSALGALSALVIGGVVDALVNYEPYTVEEPETSEEPEVTSTQPAEPTADTEPLGETPKPDASDRDGALDND